MRTIEQLSRMPLQSLRGLMYPGGSKFPGMGYTLLDGFTYSQWILCAEDWELGRGHPKDAEMAAKCRYIVGAFGN